MMNEKGNDMNQAFNYALARTVGIKRYAIYQLPFENENVRDLTFMSARQVEEISDQYEFVAIIDGRSLDDVFATSNMGDPDRETLIERIQPMHSLSVGDIVHDLADDVTYLCENVGWTIINMKEAV